VQPAYVQMPMMCNQEDPPPARRNKKGKRKQTHSMSGNGSNTARGRNHIVALSGVKESGRMLTSDSDDSDDTGSELRESKERKEEAQRNRMGTKTRPPRATQLQKSGHQLHEEEESGTAAGPARVTGRRSAIQITYQAGAEGGFLGMCTAYLFQRACILNTMVHPDSCRFRVNRHWGLTARSNTVTCILYRFGQHTGKPT